MGVAEPGPMTGLTVEVTDSDARRRGHRRRRFVVIYGRADAPVTGAATAALAESLETDVERPDDEAGKRAAGEKPPDPERRPPPDLPEHAEPPAKRDDDEEEDDDGDRGE